MDVRGGLCQMQYVLTLKSCHNFIQANKTKKFELIENAQNMIGMMTKVV